MFGENPGSRNLIALLVCVGAGLLGFYATLTVRAWLWTPCFAVRPTTRSYVVALSSGTPARLEPALRRGRRIYQDLRCGVCHGPHGEGGVKNPNADPNEVIPDLFDLGDAYTRSDLRNKIRKGYQPKKLEDDGAEPPLSMPAWDLLVSAREMRALNAYLLTLKAPPGSRTEEDGEGEEEDADEDEEEEEDDEEEFSGDEGEDADG